MPTIFNTIAGVLGNALEWYDFALFGFFSDIIAKVFFPPETGNANNNIIKSFAIFGGAFVMRPIGGLLIGYVGDKYGRKIALTGSLMLMAIPTFCMGFLPTFERAGYWSPVLLLLCRLIQGISVGGQLPASLVYTVELQPQEKWGLYGSFPMVAANCGSLLGNLVGASVRTALSEEQLVRYGWRIPFYTGILIGFVGAYLHVYGEEVHPNAAVYNNPQSADEEKNPIRKACMKQNRLALLSTWLTTMMWAGGYYLSFVWMAIYMETLLIPSVNNAFWVNACALFLGVTFCLPIAGYYSDQAGRYPCMMGAAAIMALWGPLTVYMIGARKSPLVSFFFQWVLGILLSFFGGPACAWLVETFDADVRLTSASLGYDLAHATAAGFSPAIATLLYQNVGAYSPGLLYPVLSACSLFGLCLMYRHKQQHGVESDTAVDGPPSVMVNKDLPLGDDHDLALEEIPVDGLASANGGGEVELPEVS